MALIRCMWLEVKKMEQRLIDANKIKYRTVGAGGWNQPENVVSDYEIEKMPTVDAVPTVHSEWFLNGDGSGSCMNCGKRMNIFYDEEGCMKFCPNCGAKMDGGSDEKL